MAQLRAQVLMGMYGALAIGDIANCVQEPLGLAPHSGLTPNLVQKFINKSHSVINKFINDSVYLRHMGRVGDWSPEDIDRLVLPTASNIEELESNELQEEIEDADREVEGEVE